MKEITTRFFSTEQNCVGIFSEDRFLQNLLDVELPAFLAHPGLIGDPRLPKECTNFIIDYAEDHNTGVILENMSQKPFQSGNSFIVLMSSVDDLEDLSKAFKSYHKTVFVIKDSLDKVMHE